MGTGAIIISYLAEMFGQNILAFLLVNFLLKLNHHVSLLWMEIGKAFAYSWLTAFVAAVAVTLVGFDVLGSSPGRNWPQGYIISIVLSLAACYFYLALAYDRRKGKGT